MVFLRKKTADPNVSMGMAYSLLQKCIRRCLLPESLYYGNLISTDGTPNALRKRLVQSCLEDMCRWDLALEISTCSDNKLTDYLHIVTINKKTHLSAWAQRVALDRAIQNKTGENQEMKDLIHFTILDFKKDYTSIRKFLGNHSKLFSFMNRERLVWTVKILWDNRLELQYPLIRNIDSNVIPRGFTTLPQWAKDKHVSGGKKGYQFFFDHSCVMNNRVYEEEDYEIECKKIYLLEEDKFKDKARTKHTIDRWRKGVYSNQEEVIPKVLTDNNFTNIVQIQLLTRKSHPKVYFATKNNQKYVLKGPIKQDLANRIMETERVKKLVQFPHLNVQILKLGGERWMISDSVVDYSSDVVEKESKLESKRNIYNGPTANCNFKTQLNTHFLPIIEAVLLKAVVGANDWAERNFIYSGKIVYSVDDHAMLDPVKKLTPNMRKQDKETWDKLTINHKKDIQNKLIQWKTVMEEPYLSRINTLLALLNN